MLDETKSASVWVYWYVPTKWKESMFNFETRTFLKKCQKFECLAEAYIKGWPMEKELEIPDFSLVSAELMKRH